MVRRLVCMIFASVFLLTLGATAEAAETGNLRVSLDYGEAAVGGEVTLYRVAETMEGGYRLAQTYGGGVIRQEDAQSADLAAWLAETAGGSGTSRLLDADGQTEFSDLEEGLYLLVQTAAPEGYCCAAPFLIPLPCQGQWTVQANPKTQRIETESPKTGEGPTPLLGAMGMVLSGMGLYFCAEKLRKK